MSQPLSSDLTGILGAMPEEIDALVKDLEDVSRLEHNTLSYYRGVLEGRPVLLAQSGIGKVNAAVVSQLMVTQGIRRLLFTGVAGALDPALQVGDIVVSRDAVQHDVDVTPLGYAQGQIPGEPVAWHADERLVRVALEAAQDLSGVRAVTGRVLSGDVFVADPGKVRWLRETFDGACVEMEGASVAQVCARWRLPFVIIRSISDTADQGAGVDFRTFTTLAAERAKQVVRGVLRRL